MTVTRRLAAILAADRDEISETGLLVTLNRRAEHPCECLLSEQKRTRSRRFSEALRGPMCSRSICSSVVYTVLIDEPDGVEGL
jgi:hypothetical protein